MIDPVYASGEKWFQRPEGILDGDDFDVARRFIAAKRRDLEYEAEYPISDDPNSILSHTVARHGWLELLASQEARLDAGDERTALMLWSITQREVRELEEGERVTVTGESHMFAERMALVGTIWAVPLKKNLPKD